MSLISNEEARSFLVNYQGLNDHEILDGYDGAVQFMEKVRCIQFDPLNVVGRNPDLVMQSRINEYKPEILGDLLYKDRILVDGMDKVLSIFLKEDYSKMTRVRKAVKEEYIGILSYRGSLEALNLLDEIKEYIRLNGPQPANKINIGGKSNDGKWGHKKLSSAALEYMYHSGQLGIKTKNKTQKVYDLIENLLPEEILKAKDPFDTEEEFLKWYIKRRIGCIGMVWNKNTGAWVGNYIYNQHPRVEIIQKLVEEGELLELQIERSEERFFIRKEDSKYLGTTTENNVVKFIGPLDNFIWDRGLIEEVFKFKYTWEVYTPVAKRKYGYYVLPVLYKNRFIARFEPEKNRGKTPLQIKNWWWESNVDITDEMVDAIKCAFEKFSRYLGVEMMEDNYWKEKLKL